MTPVRTRSRRPPTRAIVAWLFVAALAVAACYTGPGTDHYVAILDELDIPAGWQFVKAKTSGPNGDFQCDPVVAPRCPGVTRTYIAGSDSLRAFEEAKQVADSAGFQIDQEISPACDGRGSSLACAFSASRGNDVVLVSVDRSTSDAHLEDPSAEGAVVFVTATR